MDRWTMVLEAVPGSLSAVRVGEESHRPIDVELVDGDAETLGASLVALAEAEGGRPDHLVLVVPGDLDQERFAELSKAVDVAGLPDPSWLPETVSWAGEHLAGWGAGTPVIIIDARDDELALWSVRTRDDGVEIDAAGARDLGARLDALVAGVVHAKLAVVAPDIAEALRLRTDAAWGRDAAHLDRELRDGRRMMCATEGEELVVTVGEVEVTLTREEFTGLVDHALRDTVADAAGVERAHTIVVAGDRTSVVEHLAASSRATVLTAGASSLEGAVALVLPRPQLVEDPTPTEDLPLLARVMRVSRESSLVPLPRQPVTHGGPPRWAVPALSGLLVLSLSGAAGVLVTAPDSGIAPAVDAGAVSPVVPVGFDRLGDPGR